MTPRDRTFAALHRSDTWAVRDAYRRAIAFGANFTGVDADTERTCSAHDLMCSGVDATFDAALIAQAFRAHAERGDAPFGVDGQEVTRMLHDVSAGSARLIWRSLEVHARDTGYASDVWLSDAFAAAGALLADSAPPAPAIARSVAASLIDALASSISDRMAVPGHLAAALGANLALFMVACDAVDGKAELRFKGP